MPPPSRDIMAPPPTIGDNINYVQGLILGF